MSAPRNTRTSPMEEVKIRRPRSTARSDAMEAADGAAATEAALSKAAGTTQRRPRSKSGGKTTRGTGT